MSDQDQAPDAPPTDRRPLIAVAWLWVGIPFAYGLYELIVKVARLFTG